MAFADLNFTAALWRGRGLRWLAASAELAPELSLTAGASSPVPASQRPARPAPGHPETASARPLRRENRAASPPREESPAATGNGARWRPFTPAALPGPWRSRLETTRAGRVAWTYWALGHDLATGRGAPEGTGAEARAARRVFLARLLRDLAHPAGTHTFWPACLPEEPSGATGSGGEAAFTAHPDAFWSGAAHLGCRAVIVMGSAAVRALGLPSAARPLAQLRWRGQLVLVLWDVDALAGDETRYAPTLAFLRQGLAPAVRLA